MTTKLSSRSDDRLDEAVAGIRARIIPDFPNPAVPFPHDLPQSSTLRIGRASASRRRWMATIGGLSLTAVVLTAVALFLQPQASLADVAKAVLKQPWVHLRTTIDDKPVHEGWLSIEQKIEAFRGEDMIRFNDFQQEVYHSYAPQEQVLYRGPLVGYVQSGKWGAISESLRVLLQSGSPPEKPLEHLKMFAPMQGQMKILSQRVSKATDQGRDWLEYSVTVQPTDKAPAQAKDQQLTGPLTMWYRVDIATQLPHLCRVEATVNGRLAVKETRFQYPERGPTDIFELGVPKDAKLVDRLPSGELKRVLATIQSGRVQMDNYRAVIVEQRDPIGELIWWNSAPDSILYRKGNRFRRDLPNGVLTQETPKPADDVDLRKWWIDRASKFQFGPVSMHVGSRMYTFDFQKVPDAKGIKRREISGVKSYDYNLKPEEMFPDFATRPEFVCRPPMGIGNPNRQVSLDTEAAEGPAGCILLKVNEEKYWLDPRKDYIVMQWGVGDTSYQIEETARSPQGVWYGTRVRRKDAIREKVSGKTYDQIVHIYVDFEAELSDSLFESNTPDLSK